MHSSVILITVRLSWSVNPFENILKNDDIWTKCRATLLIKQNSSKVSISAVNDKSPWKYTRSKSREWVTAHSVNVTEQRMTGGKDRRLKTASTRPVMVWHCDRGVPQTRRGSHFRRLTRIACLQGNTPPNEQLPSHSQPAANLAIQLTPG